MSSDYYQSGVETYSDSGEEWRDVPGLRGYEVSNHGRIRSWRQQGGGVRTSPRLRVLGVSGKGYLSWTTHGGCRTYVHHVVAEAFLGTRPRGLYVCHNDGNPQNNHVCNLRYDTPSGNARDKNRHGSATLGERNSQSKLTESQVREALSSPESTYKLGAKFGVSPVSITHVRQGKTWRHLQPRAES